MVHLCLRAALIWESVVAAYFSYLRDGNACSETTCV